MELNGPIFTFWKTEGLWLQRAEEMCSVAPLSSFSCGLAAFSPGLRVVRTVLSSWRVLPSYLVSGPENSPEWVNIHWALTPCWPRCEALRVHFLCCVYPYLPVSCIYLWLASSKQTAGSKGAGIFVWFCSSLYPQPTEQGLGTASTQ